MAKMSVEDATLLAAALEGLELQKSRIDEQIARVKGMLGKGGLKVAAEATSAPAPVAEKGSKKRRLSAEGRERIAEAQRRRWAEFHKKKA